jgi:hypothetical protein
MKKIDPPSDFKNVVGSWNRIAETSAADKNKWKKMPSVILKKW